MVRALLAGTKTQTRRICKPQPCMVTQGGRRRIYADADYKKSWAHVPGMTESLDEFRDCPYGRPGDRLWVRETFGRPWHHAQPSYLYRADDRSGEVDSHPDFDGWKPSIHMPRAASRITLEIAGVRVERLQAISHDDARAEGLSFVGDGGSRFGIPGMASTWNNDPRDSYRALWESINGPGSWDANPWVWVVEFKRVQP
jgi:hypothetical protein